MYWVNKIFSANSFWTYFLFSLIIKLHSDKSHLFSPVIFRNIRSIFVTLTCGQLRLKPSWEEKNTKVIGQTDFFYPIFCALKVLSGVTAQLGCVIADRHAWRENRWRLTAGQQIAVDSVCLWGTWRVSCRDKQTPDLLTVTVTCHQGGAWTSAEQKVFTWICSLWMVSQEADFNILPVFFNILAVN